MCTSLHARCYDIWMIQDSISRISAWDPPLTQIRMHADSMPAAATLTAAIHTTAICLHRVCLPHVHKHWPNTSCSQQTQHAACEAHCSHSGCHRQSSWWRVRSPRVTAWPALSCTILRQKSSMNQQQAGRFDAICLSQLAIRLLVPVVMATHHLMACS